MMRFLINSQEVGVVGAETLEFKANFEDRLTSAELDFDSIEVPYPYASIIDEWVNQYSCFVGIPARVEFEGIAINCYIDLTDGYEVKDRSQIVKIKKALGIDNFFEWADGCTWELLASQGVAFDPRVVKYLVVKDNQIEVGITLFLSIVFTISAIQQQVKDLANEQADQTAAVGMDFANAGAMEAAAGIRAGAAAFYIAALVTALVLLVLQFIELLFPKVRYLYSSNPYKLLQKACQFKGYTFQSTLLQPLDEICFVHVPLTKENESIFSVIENLRTISYNYPYPTAADTIPTVGSLIKQMETMFNAETKISNGVVRLEHVTYFENQAEGEFTQAFNVQGEIQNSKVFNTEEAKLRYYIHYQTDYSDIHTVNDYTNTRAEYGVKNVIELSPDLNLLKGLYDVNLPFSKGSVKNTTTWIEDVALNIFAQINEFTKENNLPNISDRVLVMQISQQFFSNTKIYSVNTDGNWTEQIIEVYPNRLWEKYHRKEVIDQNGWEKFENMPMIMTSIRFQTLFENNYMWLNGEVVKILTVKYNPYYNEGTITYKRKSNYALGKITIFVVF